MDGAGFEPLCEEEISLFAKNSRPDVGPTQTPSIQAAPLFFF
jgi:hypothetical protein